MLIVVSYCLGRSDPERTGLSDGTEDEICIRISGFISW